MKTILAILVSLCAITANAEYIDLKQGGVMLAYPQMCIHDNKKEYFCVPVGKDGKTYMVLGDKKGEAFIYELTDTEAVLIWARDAV